MRDVAPDVTVVFIAHDVDMVLGWSESVVVMHFGKFVADEAPEELLANEIVAEIYLGSCDGERRA